MSSSCGRMYASVRPFALAPNSLPGNSTVLVSPSSARPPSTRTGSLFTFPRKSITNAFFGCSNTSIGVPSCSTFPLFSTTTRSATSNASSWSCVTKMLVTCSSSWKRRSQSRSSARTFASSAPNGSSSSSTFGSGASARTSAMRCFCPPDRFAGYCGRLLFEPHQAEQLLHAVAHLRFRPLAHAQAERHVLEHGHVPEQRVVLENEADVAVAGGVPGDVVVLEQHGAAVRHFQPGDDAEQGGLAGPGRAEQRDQLAGRAVDAHVVERRECAEPLGHVLSCNRHALFTAENAERKSFRRDNGMNTMIEKPVFHLIVFIPLSRRKLFVLLCGFRPLW